jgi:hypothetical protein
MYNETQGLVNTTVRRKRKPERQIVVMKVQKLLSPFLCACCVSLFSSEALSQPDCKTIGYLEELNKGVVGKRVAHIKGTNAKLFIALDPIWSLPKFDSVPYRHPKEMNMIKEDFAGLMEQRIDEVVIWNFQRLAGLAVAVPFSKGCAVSGYGEPDELEKLIIMHETLLLISKHGVDHSRVKNGIKRLLMVNYADYFDDAMIEIIIDQLRPLIGNNNHPSAE